MAKVVKREVIIQEFIECPRCKGFGEVMVRKFIGATPQVHGCSRCRGEGRIKAIDREHYWNSIDVKNLTPEQRKHFKAIMRKEVRG